MLKKIIKINNIEYTVMYIEKIKRHPKQYTEGHGYHEIGEDDVIINIIEVLDENNKRIQPTKSFERQLLNLI